MLRSLELTRRAAFVVAATGLLSALGVPAAVAACAEASEAEHFADADIVFEGIAQPGESHRGDLVSPATFEVERYLKGSGPPRLRVTTGISDGGNGMYSSVSTGITPSAGDRYRIFATGRTDEVLTTNQCMGSRRIGTSTAGEVSGPPSQPSTDAELAGSNGRSGWPQFLLIVLVLGAAATGFRAWRNTNPRTRKARR